MVKLAASKLSNIAIYLITVNLKIKKMVTNEFHEVGGGNTRKYGVGSTYCTMDGIPEKNLTEKKEAEK